MTKLGSESQANAQREKCSDMEFFLVRILPHLDWIRRDSISPYSVRMRENKDQKKLHIWTISTPWNAQRNWNLKILNS